MSPDYLYKSRILKTDLCKRINAIDKKTYLNSLDGIVFDNALESEYTDLLFQYGFNDIKEARKINHARYKRVERLNKRIETYLSSGQCIWLTITFDDLTMSKTNEKTRRVYVSRFLKQVSNHYIANIDYGTNKEYIDRKGNIRTGTSREHYHAVILTDFVDPKLWPYGFIYTERVKNHLKTSLKLSKYISKLTNHAIKESTKRTVYIYSKKSQVVHKAPYP